MADWRDRFDERRQEAGDALRRSAGLAGSVAVRGRRFVSAARQKAYEGLRDRSLRAGQRGTRLYSRYLAEDPCIILDASPAASAMLGRREVFESDPEVFGPLLNVRVRPVVSAAALATTGGGLAAFDHVLSRLTRRVFDGDQLVGGWLGPKLGSAAVNRWMDTVPGADFPGGWLHRIRHGHDLDAVAEIWSQHGSGGAVQALYHIYGRDFFTPAGVPILPTGSATVHEYLTGTVGLGKREAADLISLNFIELLGGILTIAGVLRLWRSARAVWEDSIIKRLLLNAEQAAEQEDFVTACTLVDRALAKRPAHAGLLFSRATMYHRAGNHLEAHHSYVDTVQRAAGTGSTLSLGGAEISFGGVAAAAALATSDCLARADQHQFDWADRVVAIGRAGVQAFETVSERLVDRRFVRALGESAFLPARYLSAALNSYLGGQLAGASLLLPNRESATHRLADRFDEYVRAVCERGLAPGREDDLGFMRRLVASELLPVPAALPDGSPS